MRRSRRRCEAPTWPAYASRSRSTSAAPSQVDHAVADVVGAQATRARGAGASVEDAHPVLHSADAAFRTLRAWVFHAPLPRAARQAARRLQAVAARTTSWLGADLTGGDVARAYQQLTSIHDRMRAFFETYDVLALPVSQVPPFSADEEYPADINGEPQATYLDWMRSAYLITVTGCPAISVPAGFTPEGWPVGIQLVGPAPRRAAAARGRARLRAGHPRRRPPTGRSESAAMTRRIRIGIDTGGTFTDVVAVDEDTGELAVTKTPSTPADPAVGFMTGVHKVLDALGLGGDARHARVSHGTTVATNKLLEGKVENLGFVTTEGYEFILEIARQSVPDGYGNSYFWVKPDRIVPAHRVKTVGGRLAVDGSEIRPFDERARGRARRAGSATAGIDTIGVCFLHSYVDDTHERAMRDVLAREHPDAVVSISQRGAARVPRVRARRSPRSSTPR